MLSDQNEIKKKLTEIEESYQKQVPPDNDERFKTYYPWNEVYLYIPLSRNLIYITVCTGSILQESDYQPRVSFIKHPRNF